MKLHSSTIEIHVSRQELSGSGGCLTPANVLRFPDPHPRQRPVFYASTRNGQGVSPASLLRTEAPRATNFRRLETVFLYAAAVRSVVLRLPQSCAAADGSVRS